MLQAVLAYTPLINVVYWRMRQNGYSTSTETAVLAAKAGMATTGTITEDENIQLVIDI